MKNRSLLILATSSFFLLLNWQCSSKKQVVPELGISGMYKVNQFVSGDSIFNDPYAYIATTQLSRDQIQIFFAFSKNGKQGSKDLATFNVEPTSINNYAILRGGTRVGSISGISLSLDLDANSPNRLYVEGQK